MLYCTSVQLIPQLSIRVHDLSNPLYYHPIFIFILNLFHCCFFVTEIMLNVSKICFFQSRSHIVDDAQRETAMVVLTETQTYNRQLIFTQTRQDDKSGGGRGGGMKVEGRNWSFLDEWYMNSHHFHLFLLRIPSWFQLSLCLFILNTSIHQLICQAFGLIPSSLEFSTLSSSLASPGHLALNVLYVF